MKRVGIQRCERVIPNIPGTSFVTVVVDDAPGGVSAPHTHAKLVCILAYVVSGAIESQVNDQPERIYQRQQALVPPAPQDPTSMPRKRQSVEKLALAQAW